MYIWLHMYVYYGTPQKIDKMFFQDGIHMYRWCFSYILDVSNFLASNCGVLYTVYIYNIYLFIDYGIVPTGTRICFLF